MLDQWDSSGKDILHFLSLLCVFECNLHYTHGLPPSTPSPGLPPYYTNAFIGHALLCMPVNCLVNI